MITGCKKDGAKEENPLISEWDTPYGIPPFDKIRPEHYAPAFERAMAIHDAEIDAIARGNGEATFESVMLPYDRSGEMLTTVSLIFEMMSSAVSTPELQAVEEQVLPRLAAHYDRILLDEALFERIRRVYDNRHAQQLDDEQLRLVEKTYDEFVRAGALLSPDDKKRLKEINGQLSLTAVKYGANLLHDTDAFRLELTADDITGLPSAVRDAARAKAEESGLSGKYVFTLHKPSLIPFMTYSDRRDLRERLYTAYLNRCNRGDEYDNKALINDFVRLRTEKAHLLGYKSYAEYVISDQMAGSTAAVYALLDEIWEPALKLAEKELAAMQELFAKDYPDGEFASWDWWYYAEKVRKRDYSLDEEMLKPYFSVDAVQNGVFYLANRLYGITFRPIIAPHYNSDCRAFEVLDADETHLGVLYFDFYQRTGKRGGAWCGNFTPQTYDADGNRVAPVVGITCNFPQPNGSTPALLTMDDAETLFHEFGHAMHFLFADVRYRGLSDVEGDFVELPSQVMENWAFHPEMLVKYAVHYRSGDIIPKNLIDKIRRSAYFNQGFATTELLAAALSDLDIHSVEEYSPIDVEAFETEALNAKRGLIPQIAPRYRYPYFSHVFDGGYSAGYYFYIWAEVLDKDAFQAFVESGDVFNRRIAADFRNKLLRRGGSDAGMNLYRAFRGKDPDKTALLRARGMYEEPATDSIPEPNETETK